MATCKLFQGSASPAQPRSTPPIPDAREPRLAAVRCAGGPVERVSVDAERLSANRNSLAHSVLLWLRSCSKAGMDDRLAGSFLRERYGSMADSSPYRRRSSRVDYCPNSFDGGSYRRAYLIGICWRTRFHWFGGIHRLLGLLFPRDAGHLHSRRDHRIAIKLRRSLAPIT